jgi:hypothetical protein
MNNCIGDWHFEFAVKYIRPISEVLGHSLSPIAGGMISIWNLFLDVNLSLKCSKATCGEDTYLNYRPSTLVLQHIDVEVQWLIPLVPNTYFTLSACIQWRTTVDNPFYTDDILPLRKIDLEFTVWLHLDVILGGKGMHIVLVQVVRTTVITLGERTIEELLTICFWHIDLSWFTSTRSRHACANIIISYFKTTCSSIPLAMVFLEYYRVRKAKGHI